MLQWQKKKTCQKKQSGQFAFFFNLSKIQKIVWKIVTVKSHIETFLFLSQFQKDLRLKKMFFKMQFKKNP